MHQRNEATMSAELTKARQQLASIRTYLRMGKPQPAVQALHSTIHTILRTPLMKSERDEFERLLEDGVYLVTADPQVKQIFPLQVIYEHGKERELLEDLRGLLEAFDCTIRDEAEEAMRLLEERKNKLLKEGSDALERGEFDVARMKFQLLAREYRDDSNLIGHIGELLLQYQQYDEAIVYLESALEMSPELAHLYNQIGMALRKVKKFETAEKYYLKASNYLGHDPNLFFNLGRLYMDWGNWDKSLKSAEAALKLEPEFMEAQKLANYVRKMQEKELTMQSAKSKKKK